MGIYQATPVISISHTRTKSVFESTGVNGTLKFSRVNFREIGFRREDFR